MSQPKKLFRLKNCTGFWTRWYCRRLRRIRTVKLADDKATAEQIMQRMAALIAALELLGPHSGLPKDFDPQALLRSQGAAHCTFSDKDIAAVMRSMIAALKALDPVPVPRTDAITATARDYTMHCVTSRVAHCIQLLHASLKDITMLTSAEHEALKSRNTAAKKAKT